MERNYRCIGGNATTASICFVKLKALSITAKGTAKVKGKNSGTFTYALKGLPNVALSPALVQAVQFISPQSCHVASWSFSEKELTVVVDYSQDLEDYPATLLLTLSPLFLTPPSASFSFTVASDDYLLLYNAAPSELLNILRYVFVGIMGVTLLLGVLSHKMIVAEKLVLLMGVYLSYLVAPKKTETLSVVEYFSLFTLNLGYLDNYKTNCLLRNAVAFYSSDNREYSHRLLLLTDAAILALFLTGAIAAVLSERAKKAVTHMTALLYNRVVFPWVVGLLFFRLSALTDSPPSRSTVESLVGVIGVVLSSAVLFLEGLSFLGRADSGVWGVPRSREWFVCLFCAYVLAVTFISLAAAVGVFS